MAYDDHCDNVEETSRNEGRNEKRRLSEAELTKIEAGNSLMKDMSKILSKNAVPTKPSYDDQPVKRAKDLSSLMQ